MSASTDLVAILFYVIAAGASMFVMYMLFKLVEAPLLVWVAYGIHLVFLIAASIVAKAGD